MSSRTLEVPLRTSLAVGLALGLVVGLLDLALGLLDPRNAVELHSLARGAAATAGVSTLLFTPWAVWLGRRRSRTLGLTSLPWVLGSFAAVSSVAAIPLAIAFAGGSLEPRLTPGILGLALLVGALTLWLAALHDRLGELDSALPALCVAAPLICAQLAALALLDRTELSGLSEMRPLASLGCALLALFTVWGAWRVRQVLPATPVVAIAMAVLLGIGFAPRGETRPLARSAKSATHSGFISGAKAPRRVILIVVDTLRADALSCLGAPSGATPAIDALASDGILFTQARSCSSFTLPSMASILTGSAPELHQLIHVGLAVPRNLPSLAPGFQEAGWTTGAVGTNSVLVPGAGFERGFEEYRFFPEARAETPLGSKLLHVAGIDRPADGRASALTDLACDWIGRHQDEDSFLWLHYFDPHFPYEPPQAYRPAGKPNNLLVNGYFLPREVRYGHLVADAAKRERVKRFYDGEVRYTDQQLARLIEFLKARGLYQDTLIVFTADHGEEFWEHGLVEHGQSLFDELVRVPLIVKPAGAMQPSVVEHPVSTSAVPATIFELCGLSQQSSAFSVPTLLRNGPSGIAAAGPEPVFSAGTLFYEPRSAAVFEGFKYIRFAITGREELYDLAADPREQRSLHGEALARLELGRRLLEEHEQRSEELRAKFGIRAATAAELSSSVIDELHKMGYLK
jgi:arylsulfatase A-like enzyme